MATSSAGVTPQPSNTSKALGLLLNVLQVLPEVGPAVALARSLASDLKALTAGGADVTPEQLQALEQQTATLMAQVDDDVKGLGIAGQL